LHVEDHVVAGDDVRHALTDRFDQPCGLVAEKKRELVVDATLAVVQVGVADAARLNGNDGLTRPGIGDDNGLHRDRLAFRLGNDSADFLAHAAERIAHAVIEHARWHRRHGAVDRVRRFRRTFPDASVRSRTPFGVDQALLWGMTPWLAEAKV
jgi:hypothetical protein